MYLLIRSMSTELLVNADSNLVVIARLQPASLQTVSAIASMYDDTFPEALQGMGTYVLGSDDERWLVLICYCWWLSSVQERVQVLHRPGQSDAGRLLPVHTVLCMWLPLLHLNVRVVFAHAGTMHARGKPMLQNRRTHFPLIEMLYAQRSSRLIWILCCAASTIEKSSCTAA